MGVFVVLMNQMEDGRGGRFMALKATVETSFQIHPFLRNHAFRWIFKDLDTSNNN